jgi:hypothetical protein
VIAGIDDKLTCITYNGAPTLRSQTVYKQRLPSELGA